MVILDDTAVVRAIVTRVEAAISGVDASIHVRYFEDLPETLEDSAICLHLVSLDVEGDAHTGTNDAHTATFTVTFNIVASRQSSAYAIASAGSAMRSVLEGQALTSVTDHVVQVTRVSVSARSPEGADAPVQVGTLTAAGTVIRNANSTIQDATE